MPALTDALERLATRGDAAGGDVVLARARAGTAVTEAIHSPRRPVRWRAVVAAAAVVAIAVPVSMFARRHRASHSPPPVVAAHGTLPFTTASTVVPATAAQLARFHWPRIGPLPAGIGQLAPGIVWDGNELLVFGLETTDGDERGVVARYRPSDDTWRMSRPAPKRVSLLGGVSSVAWTGRELVALGMGFDTGDRVAAVAYDPARDRWRALPDAPLCTSNRPSTVWTGRVLVVTTGSIIHGESSCPDPSGAGVAAFDPVSDRWSVLPSLPRRVGEYVNVVTLGTAFDGVVALVELRAGVASSTPGTATAGTMAPGTWRTTRTVLAVLHPGATQWQPLAEPATPWPGIVPAVFGDAHHAFVAPLCNGPRYCVGLQVVTPDGHTRRYGDDTNAQVTAFTGAALLTIATDPTLDCVAPCNNGLITAWDLTTRRTRALGHGPEASELIWTGQEVIASGSEPAGAGSRAVLFRFGP